MKFNAGVFDMRKLIVAVILLASMLAPIAASAEMVAVRLGPYTTTGEKAWIRLDTNGPVFYQVHGTVTSFDIDFETSIFPSGYEATVDSVYAADWKKIETAITAEGTGSINYVGAGFRVDVDAINVTDLYVDLWYERVR